MPDGSSGAVLGAKSERRPAPSTLAFHHVAVQTPDLRASIAWYKEFFGAEVSWTLETFSDLSMERLPGLSGVAEVTAGGLRFHLFSCGPKYDAPPPPDVSQFQHVCVEVRSREELSAWHARWHAVRESGDHAFAREALASDIVVDGDGVLSFYAFDINGVEFEFTCFPGVQA